MLADVISVLFPPVRQLSFKSWTSALCPLKQQEFSVTENLTCQILPLSLLFNWNFYRSQVFSWGLEDLIRHIGVSSVQYLFWGKATKLLKSHNIKKKKPWRISFSCLLASLKNFKSCSNTGPSFCAWITGVRQLPLVGHVCFPLLQSSPFSITLQPRGERQKIKTSMSTDTLRHI